MWYLSQFRSESTSRHRSSSAACLFCIRILFFCNRKSDAVFGASRVDSHNRVHLLFCHPALVSYSNTLSDLTGVWRANVEAHDAVVVSAVHKYLGIGHAFTFCDLLVDLPLKRLELRVISGDVICTEAIFCVLFGQTNRSVLQRREHGSWDAFVVHYFIAETSKA